MLRRSRALTNCWFPKGTMEQYVVHNYNSLIYNSVDAVLANNNTYYNFNRKFDITSFKSTYSVATITKLYNNGASSEMGRKVRNN